MTERAVLFGQGAGLLGIVSEPEEASRVPVAVILLNAGLVYRIGPNRLYVRLARMIAAAGQVALRFDFSGIGDSAARAENLSPEQSAIKDTVEAMDFLQRRGSERFILMGMCFGADAALQVAYRDPRVVGVALVNGSEFRRLDFSMMPTAESTATARQLANQAGIRVRLRYYMSSLFDQRAWQRLLNGESDLRSMRRLFAEASRMGFRLLRGRAVPRLTADCRLLTDREVELLLIYSDGSEAWDLYSLNWEPELRRVRATGRLQIDVVPHVDHVFTPRSAQEYLLARTRRWLSEEIGRGVVSQDPA